MAEKILDPHYPPVDKRMIGEITQMAHRGFLSQSASKVLLDAAGITRARQYRACNEHEARVAMIAIGGPVAMKAVIDEGKQARGALALNVSDIGTLRIEFARIMNIEGVTAVSIEPMLEGEEVYIYATRKYMGKYDISCGIVGEKTASVKRESPITPQTAAEMVENFDIGVNKFIFAENIRRVSALCDSAPSILSVEINPLIGNDRSMTALNARISIDNDD
ncbi:MAG: acetate--CoA ligase family protein [Bacteroidales bacterium]|nr:acetate--CoA ligase family protein [Bacteroidales bacterium]